MILCCSQARWDNEGVIAKYLPQMLVNKRVGIENAEIQAVANATAFSCGNTFATRITKSAHIYFEKFKKLKFSKWNHCLGSFAGSCNEVLARRIYDRLGDMLALRAFIDEQFKAIKSACEGTPMAVMTSFIITIIVYASFFSVLS